jgi:2-oxoglutarate dehydrogenase E2 component (dihydrolipoamide succinyltransferase)
MADTIDILMPLEQEGSKSVVRVWLKQIGDSVKRDEPLLELETDKVAVEVPAPADGVLAEITLNEGDEAAPGAVLGVLNTENTEADRRLPGGISKPAQQEPAGSRRSESVRLSPLVKRMVSEHKLDIAAIPGSGRDGRVTHKDVEAFVDRASSDAQAGLKARGPTSKLPHDAMRRSIAAHMQRSVQTAPHVTAVFEADFSAIAAHRAKHKESYAKAGAPLTYSAYFIAAAADAMNTAPNVNARWHDDFLEVFEDVNIGIGVALGEKGLIVPVIARAQALSLKQIAARLADLTERARKNQLKPADVQGGTFTISNHGVSGSLVAAPIIINQPQAAILGIGKLEKRVVVSAISGADAMVIKPMAYVSLTIDHRVLDGHQTNAWLTRFVATLEAWPLEHRP